MDKNKLIIKEIANLLKIEDAVLFLGAGFSVGAGLPSGNQLKKLIVERYLFNGNYESTDLAHIIEEVIHRDIEKEKNQKELFDYLQSIFVSDNFGNETHKLLAQIPFIKQLFTTNYDNLIEQAYERKINIVFNNETYSCQKPNWPTIFKIHGDFMDPSSIVLSQEGYSKVIANQGNNLVYNHLKDIVSTKAFVFIGFSLDDLDVSSTIEQITSLRGSPITSFFISPKITLVQKNRLFHKKITCIESTGEDFIAALHQELLQYLPNDIESGLILPTVANRFALKNGIRYDVRIDKESARVDGKYYIDEHGIETIDGTVSESDAERHVTDEQAAYFKQQLGSKLTGNESKLEILTKFLHEADRTLQENRRNDVMSMFKDIPRHSQSTYARINKNFAPIGKAFELREYWWNDLTKYEISCNSYFIIALVLKDNLLSVSFGYNLHSPLVHERIAGFMDVNEIVNCDTFDIYIPWENREFEIINKSQGIPSKQEFRELDYNTELWYKQMLKLLKIQEHFKIQFYLPTTIRIEEANAIEIVYSSIVCESNFSYETWQGIVEIKDKETIIDKEIIIDKENAIRDTQLILPDIVLFGFRFIPDALYISPCKISKKRKNKRIPGRCSFVCQKQNESLQEEGLANL